MGFQDTGISTFGYWNICIRLSTSLNILLWRLGQLKTLDLNGTTPSWAFGIPLPRRVDRYIVSLLPPNTQSLPHHLNLTTSQQTSNPLPPISSNLDLNHHHDGTFLRRHCHSGSSHQRCQRWSCPPDRQREFLKPPLNIHRHVSDSALTVR